jgi:hypothetical protein
MLMNQMHRARSSLRIKKREEDEEDEDDNSSTSSSNSSNNNERQSPQQQLRGFRRALTSTFSAPSRNRRHSLFTHSASSIGNSNTSASRSAPPANSNSMATSPSMTGVMRCGSGAPSAVPANNADDDDSPSSSCSDRVTSTTSLTTRNTSTPTRRRPTLDTSHTIVLYKPSSQASVDEYNRSHGLIQSWCQVVHAAHAVWQSREMERLQLTTSHLCYVASRTALQTALLPVTVPLHLVSTSTRCVVDTSKFVVVSASQLVLGTGRTRTRGAAALTSSSSSTDEQAAAAVEERHDGLIDLPGRVLGFVGNVTLHLIVGKSYNSNNNNNSSCRAAATSSQSVKKSNKDYDYDDFLARLRLDYYDEADVSKDKNKTASSLKDKKERQPQDDDSQDEEELSCSAKKSSGSVPTAMKMKTTSSESASKFLLRVDDLELYCDTDASSKNSTLVLYIDLDAKNHGDCDAQSSSSSLTLQATALSEFTRQGLAMIANHPTVRLMAKQYLATSRNEIVWKCENSCQRIMREMSKMSTVERLQTLEKETLVWSGQFRNQQLPLSSSSSSALLSPSQQQQQSIRRSMPLYLARGIIRCSPREFVNLLWDNTRTSTYNNFCLGRVTILDVNGDSQRVLSGETNVGTKVIQSETRIPFTNLSVSMYCLMHVRPLDDPDEGFVIMSRSLVTGTAETHTSTSANNSYNIQEGNKNEIIWGMNIIRRVPNHPHLADLTSLSQGGSSLVPKFVFSKIAMMGISEFFDNVRKLDLSSTPITASSRE